MNLTELAKRISHLNYVVQRNWEKLPGDMQGDLDLFVSNEDYEELNKIVDEFDHPELVDIRQPGDGYYPPEIEKELLSWHTFHGGFKIPNDWDAWIALFYHNAVHKQDHKYDAQLRREFLEFEGYSPVKAEDEGVGYFPEQ